MATRIQLRRGTAAQWTSANPVLASGEPAVETDTGKRKIGDGVRAWTDLPYDVSADDLGTAAAADVRDFISAAQPESYGAVGDGIADDTDAVQAALNAGAGGIVLLTGTYGFSETLVVPGHTRVEGGGTLQLLPGYDLTALSFRAGDMMYPYVLAGDDGTVLRDFTVTGVEGDTREQRHIGVLYHDCLVGVAENLRVHHINWDPALAASSTETLGYGLGTVRAEHITIRGGWYDFGGYQNIGIADGSRNILVDGVYCGSGWRTSLQIHRDVWDVDVVNSLIDNVQPTADSAFTIHPLPETAPTGRVRISNTRIRGIVDPSANRRGGLQLVDSIHGLTLSNVDIESNRWGASIIGRDVSLSGVNCTGGQVGLEIDGTNLSIEGGRFVSTEWRYAIEIRGTSVGARLSGVHMDATQGGAVSSAGIRASGDSISISGCVIKGHSYGAWITGGEAKRVSLTDNIVASVADNALYHNGSNALGTLTLRGNVITAPSNRRGVLVSAPLVGAIVQANTVLGGSVGVRITDAASRAIVKDNNLLGATVGTEILAPDSIVQDNLVSA